MHKKQTSNPAIAGTKLTDPADTKIQQEHERQARNAFARTLTRALSLPGKLLGLSVLFVMIAEVMIYVPSAMNFRTEWLMDRVEAAHLAALAAESAGDMELSQARVRELLSGAGIIAVARVSDGANELVLGGDLGGRIIIPADLMNENFFDRFSAFCHTLLSPPGQYLRVIARPSTRQDELISVILPEDDLRRELIAYSRNITLLSLLIAFTTGTLIYICLLFILVGPMRRLADAMTAFQKDPTDLSRAFEPSGRSDEIGQAERALAAMENEVRTAFTQRERLAALGGAVARINHDLRNVLASAQLISDRLSMNQDQRIAQMGDRLLRAVDRGVRLCEDTLQYGKTSERPAELRAIHLRNALDDAAGDAFAASGAAEWINDIDEFIYVEADPDHLHRIVLNLVRNAIQAMPANPGQIRAEAEVHDTQVIVSLTDTGPGIPDAIRETLFQPFARTGSAGGTGLGLSIAQELAHAMGGHISLNTTGSTGTRFDITLNLAG